MLELDANRIMLDLGMSKEQYNLEYQDALTELLLNEYVVVTYPNPKFTVFIIKEHFLSLSKSKLNIRKAIDEGKSSPYQTKLREIYSPEDFKHETSFTPPTPEEVTNYALSKGYVVNGNTFVDYYASNDWYNKNNKKVRNWKATLDRVWCREESKLELVDGAPKGFEYFHITLDNGERVSPEGWKNDKPTHSNFLYAELLIEEFNECTTT